MSAIRFTGTILVVCWTIFVIFFKIDRSRYRNCYLLFFALLSTLLFLIAVGGSTLAMILFDLIFIAILLVPMFLIHNGVVMVKREGRSLSHMLSLGLGIAIAVGEITTLAMLILVYMTHGEAATQRLLAGVSIAGVSISVTVIYGSVSFLMFTLYTLFLHIIPLKRDFDYVIIHGSGLIEGQRVPRLLRDRLDKAIQVYRKDPTPPKMIPSGGQGSDEEISEAEAMRKYLLENGIPESDILIEDASRTTFENLKNSKAIIDAQEGRKYTALVTSNYHVYRALRYCRRIGFKCTGIGSHVAYYYWPSALIREYIAIHKERKHAVLSLLCWAFWMFLFLWPMVRR